MSNHDFRAAKPADTYQTHSLETGIAPVGSAPQERQVTQKEKVEIWFINPLRKLENDDGFVCLLICFPLIEAVVRYELGVADDVDLKFSDNSPALKWIANFLTIPEAKAREAWDALRNGLMHRGIIKSATSYVLTGEKPGRPAEFNGDVLRIYVWELRDCVVNLLAKHHKRLWQDSGCLLPRISVVR